MVLVMHTLFDGFLGCECIKNSFVFMLTIYVEADVASNIEMGEWLYHTPIDI